MEIMYNTSYLVGFKEAVQLHNLDLFMDSLGFSITDPKEFTSQKYNRIYSCNKKIAPITLDFFYQIKAEQEDIDFLKPKERIISYGDLNFRYPIKIPTREDIEYRRRIILEKAIRTEYEYCKNFYTPENLLFYETALKFKEKYGALVVSEATGDEINPDRPFNDSRAVNN